MTGQFAEDGFDLEDALRTEYPRLVRICAHISGNPQVADDLAQETLFEAWRNAHKLVEPRGYAKWFYAIAQNVCRRWARREGRKLEQAMDWTAIEDEAPSVLQASTAARDSFEWELERDDLAKLLDRAMSLLPPKTRQVLIWRYIKESSQAEVAARLDMSENAVAVRLHRGRLAMRQILSTELREDVSAYGVMLPSVDAWQKTRVWCPICGRHQLEGYFVEADFAVRCPHCSLNPDDYLAEHVLQGGLLDGLKVFKPALSRILNWGFRYYQQGLETGELPCYACGRSARLILSLPDYAPGADHQQRGFHMLCEHCAPQNYGTLEQYALAVPDVQQFWREQPRIRVLPEQALTVEGRSGLMISFESLNSQAKLDLLLDQETYQVISVHRCG